MKFNVKVIQFCFFQLWLIKGCEVGFESLYSEWCWSALRVFIADPYIVSGVGLQHVFLIKFVLISVKDAEMCVTKKCLDQVVY